MLFAEKLMEVIMDNKKQLSELSTEAINLRKDATNDFLHSKIKSCSPTECLPHAMSEMKPEHAANELQSHIPPSGESSHAGKSVFEIVEINDSSECVDWGLVTSIAPLKKTVAELTLVGKDMKGEREISVSEPQTKKSYPTMSKDIKSLETPKLDEKMKCISEPQTHHHEAECLSPEKIFFQTTTNTIDGDPKHSFSSPDATVVQFKNENINLDCLQVSIDTASYRPDLHFAENSSNWKGDSKTNDRLESNNTKIHANDIKPTDSGIRVNEAVEAMSEECHIFSCNIQTKEDFFDQRAEIVDCVIGFEVATSDKELINTTGNYQVRSSPQTTNLLSDAPSVIGAPPITRIHTIPDIELEPWNYSHSDATSLVVSKTSAENLGTFEHCESSHTTSFMTSQFDSNDPLVRCFDEMSFMDCDSNACTVSELTCNQIKSQNTCIGILPSNQEGQDAFLPCENQDSCQQIAYHDAKEFASRAENSDHSEEEVDTNKYHDSLRDLDEFEDSVQDFTHSHANRHSFDVQTASNPHSRFQPTTGKCNAIRNDTDDNLMTPHGDNLCGSH